MDSIQKFSCFLIGEGPALIQCAEILVNRGHTIYGLVSSDHKAQRWAQEYKFPYIEPKLEDILHFISQLPFDYLFSIVNPFILPKQVLELPRIGAINYHDAPLPKYAGSYATSWAIMQGEKTHGITWHEMVDRVDAGRIFKQRYVVIDDNETAFSLNTKCYDAAISSFSELVDDLASGNVLIQQQNLTERSFYPLSKRPSSGCVLSWSSGARELCNFVRALNFGPYDNPFGLPKLAVGNTFVLVPELEEVTSSSASPPGTITAIDANFMKIATGNGEVLVSKLLTINGQPLPLSIFRETFNLYKGYRFADLDAETAARITAYNASIRQYETFWAQYLKTLEKAPIPYAQRNRADEHQQRYTYTSMPIPLEVMRSLKERHETWSIEDYLLTAFVIFQARLADVWNFDIGYRDAELKRELTGLEGMFCAYAFLHVTMDSHQSIERISHTIDEQLKLTKKRKTYACDIVARFPDLGWQARLPGAYQPSVLVERVETLDSYQIPQDIELALVILDGGQECLWAYDTEIFSAASIENMQHQFATLLLGSIANVHKPISQLPLVTNQERYRLLKEWNATQADYPQDQCVHELFEAQVQRTPHAIAVTFEDAQLSYQELNERANQLAHYLRQCGVGPEVIVGLCAERSLEMLVGMLAIFKSGGTYVPLDPSFPTERLAFVFQDSQMAILVTQQSLLKRLPTAHPHVLCLDTDWQTISQQSKANPQHQNMSQHVAYMIYTSGSTGQPKGVLIEHHSLTAHCWSFIERCRFSPTDSILQFIALTFDPSIEQIFSALLVGSKLVLRGEEVWSPTELLQRIRMFQLTVLQLPVTYWHQALQEWVHTPQLLLDLPLKLVIVGGDRFPIEVVQLWRTTPLRSLRLINSYGPTEATIATATYEVAYDQEGQEERIPIGRPLANRTLYILDRQGSLVPIGVPGELYIGGVGVARGYLNRPDLTDEQFIPDRFCEEPGARLYRTGDIVRYREDANIEFLTRVDDQVKIRGYRIEPGEIEAVLRQHPAVHQAVVVAREDIRRDKYLAAYLVLHKGKSVKLDELKDYMAKFVASYMIPSAFLLLDTLPLTAHGKVDRTALPTADFSSRTGKATFVAPKHMLHFQLIAIWEELLNVHPIGIADNFFDLGGHSLLALRLLQRIEEVFHQKLPLNMLFSKPTIEGLADVLRTKVSHDIELPIIEIQRGEAKRPFFFLHGQWHGDAFYCYHLARAVGKEQPFYAIPPHHLSKVSTAPTIEEIAAYHLQALQSTQGDGPYILGGWCNGALVAYEMARQLHAQGKSIDSLILISPSQLTPTSRLEKVCKFVDHIGKFLHVSPEKRLYSFLRLNHLGSYLLYPNYRKTIEVEQLKACIRTKWAKREKRGGGLLAELQLLFPPIQSLHTYPLTFAWAVTNYAPFDGYPGMTTFIWHRDEPFDSAAWHQVVEVAKTEEYFLPGTHETLLTEHISTLAERIQLCLNKANDLQRENSRRNDSSKKNTSASNKILAGAS